MYEIKRRIDDIMICGLLLTTNDIVTDDQNMFSKPRLDAMVGYFLERYIFEDSGPDVKKWFNSDSGRVNMCTKIIDRGDKVYTCLDCQIKESCSICEDCFLHSKHVDHKNKHWISDSKYATCDCGDVYAWRCEPRCSNHMIIYDQGHSLPSGFLEIFTNKILLLCEVLKQICGDDCCYFNNYMANMLDAYLQIKESNTSDTTNQKTEKLCWNPPIDANARKSCLLMMTDVKIDRLILEDILSNIPNMPRKNSEKIASCVDEYGYASVLFMCDPHECQIAKEYVEKWMRTVSYDHNISFRIIKLYSVYFMKLGPIIMNLIYKLCFGKTLLCELLSEILFKKTALAQVFMDNEHLLWKELRQEMFIRILFVAKYSNSGKICAATLFLHNVRSLYDHLLEDHCERRYGFFGLIEQILHCPPVVVYLVENGFLIKILIIFSNSLKSMDINTGSDLVQMYIKSKASRRDVSQLLEKMESLSSCLQISLKNIEQSELFISKCTEAGKYLVQFCADFDDMQPCNKMSIDVSYLQDFDFLLLLYGRFILILSQLVKWIVLFDECAATTLKTFLDKFACIIKIVSDGVPCEFIYQKMVSFCNVETEKFSLFNLSNRVFFDILTVCSVKGTLPREISSLIFDDDKMLMWVARPAITAITSVMNNVLPNMSEIGNNMSYHIFVYQKSYLRYFFLHDFSAIQILILHLDPELLIKYIWFNIVPSLQKRVDMIIPLSLILRLQDPNICLGLRRVFILIYNALIEYYFGSFSQNRDYHVLARQIIHSLASGHDTVKDIQKHMCVCHNMFEGTSTFICLKNFLEKVLEKVSFKRNLPNTEKLLLKPEYLNSVNMFHLMYSLSDVYFVVERLKHLFKSKLWKFTLPDFINSSKVFGGIHNFLYSDALSNLILRILTEWYENIGKDKKGSIDILIMISIILCIMLKMPVNGDHLFKFHKAFDLIFGIKKYLGDNNVITLLAFLKKTLNHEIYGSVVDYLMELSQIPKNYFKDLSENTSAMIHKSKDCTDLALKKLYNKYNEISKNKVKAQRDQKDLSRG